MEVGDQLNSSQIPAPSHFNDTITKFVNSLSALQGNLEVKVQESTQNMIDTMQMFIWKSETFELELKENIDQHVLNSNMIANATVEIHQHIEHNQGELRNMFHNKIRGMQQLLNEHNRIVEELRESNEKGALEKITHFEQRRDHIVGEIEES
jgi:hypothetical protein